MLNVVVLAGDVSCAWPVSDFLPFYPLEVSGNKFFLATLARSQIIMSILYFNFIYCGLIYVIYMAFTTKASP